MAASDRDTVAFIYKKNYSDHQPADVAERDHPLFASTPREGGFTGASYDYALKYEDDQGVSGLFDRAQTNARPMSGVQWTARQRLKYGVITLDGPSMRYASNDKGSFMRLVTKSTDGILRQMGADLAFDLYRDGNGIRGRRSSAAANVITLTVPDHARYFRRNMTIGADDTSTGASPKSGTTYIKKVSIKGGNITLNDAAAISGFADNDYLFRDGDPGTCMEGLASHNPLVEPTSGDSFRGNDRSDFPELLAGFRIDDSNTSIEENVGLLSLQQGTLGRNARECYINPINFFKITRRGNAKVEYQKAGGTMEWGFQFCTIVTPGGTVKLISDPDCPLDRFHLINPDSHYIKHLDGIPHIIMDDGGKAMLRQVSADGLESRARFMGNYVQDVPGDFGVGAIPT